MFKDFKDIIENYKKESNKPSIQVANIVIDYCDKNNIKDLTNLKLLKLLYFINAKHLVETNGTSLFPEELFEAWRHGPVLRSVYDRFKHGIIIPNHDTVEKAKNSFDAKTLNIIIKTLEKYAHLDSWVLVEKTHENGSPWDTVYQSNSSNGHCNAMINNNDIYEFYKNARI